MYKKEIIESFLEFLGLSTFFGFLSGLINDDVRTRKDWIKVLVTAEIMGIMVGFILKGMGYNDFIIWGSIVAVAVFSLLIYKLIVKLLYLVIEQPLECFGKLLKICRGRDCDK